MLHLKAANPLITLVLCLYRSTPSCGTCWEKQLSQVFSLRLTGKNKYESEDSVERKAQRGADFDSLDLFRFSLKKLRKWKSKASI